MLPSHCAECRLRETCISNDVVWLIMCCVVTESHPLLHGVRLTLTFLTLVLPTTLMGMCFPMLAHATTAAATAFAIVAWYEASPAADCGKADAISVPSAEMIAALTRGCQRRWSPYAAASRLRCLGPIAVSASLIRRWGAARPCSP